MTWQCYHVVLRLLTPLHIGWIKVGNLHRTRPYALGKNLWAALTMRLTRDEPSLNGDYRATGVRLNEELAFSYFYPTDDASGSVCLSPWADPDEFSWRYLGACASTAINHDLRSAEENSLHETEFITPHTRDGKQVYLVGYIFEHHDCSLRWRGALSRLQLGGERTYGWGRLELAGEVLGVNEAGFLGGWKVALDGQRPILRDTGERRLYAHAVARGIVAKSGSIEPLVGRETQDGARHGANLSVAQVCWAPGSVVEPGQVLEVVESGIWRKASAEDP